MPSERCHRVGGRRLLALALAATTEAGTAASPGRQLLDANATAAALDQGLFYPDAPDGLCQPGYNCTAGGIPASRGVCVLSGVGAQCWDVCNPQHTPQEYQMGDTNVENAAAQNAALAGLIAQVRQGLNSFVKCPGQLGMGDMCPPGSLCKGHMLFKFKVPAGRGMCVVDESEPNSRACWDMCDPAHDPEDFTDGTAEGTASHVWEVRRGGGCPSTPWWPWLLVALITVCLLTCCIWVFTVLFRMGRKRTRGLGLERPSSSRQEFAAEPELGRELRAEDYGEPAPPPAIPEEDYGARGASVREDYRIPDPPPMSEYMQDGMPPEPPRGEMMVQGRELPPPPLDPKLELFEKIDANHDGQISRSEYEAFFPGSTQAKIPGLDEPNLLFTNIQPLVVPTTTAQVAPPDLLLQAMPRTRVDPLSGSQPQVMTPFRMSTSGSQQAAFQTQLSPAFSSQPLGPGSAPGSLPGSLRLQPGAPSPASPPFFTRVNRY